MLVPTEEEKLAVQNGSAKVSAELIALEIRFGSRQGETVDRVGVIIAEKLKNPAMKLIATGFGDDVDGCAGMHAVLRREARGLNTELLENVREGKWHVDVRKRVVMVTSIQEVVDLISLTSSDGNVK